VLTLYNRAEGRQKSKCLPYEVCVKLGLKVDLGDLAMFIFLCEEDVGDKVVPVEEPPPPETV
jgi:hypothetical protein